MATEKSGSKDAGTSFTESHIGYWSVRFLRASFSIIVAAAVRAATRFT
jgi:hypothetical protein